jgi:ATP synthase protein I
MITGMAVYGAVGWLIGRWTAISVLFPIGMLAGLACGIALVIFRFGRN